MRQQAVHTILFSKNIFLQNQEQILLPFKIFFKFLMCLCVKVVAFVVVWLGLVLGRGVLFLFIPLAGWVAAKQSFPARASYML